MPGVGGVGLFDQADQAVGTVGCHHDGAQRSESDQGEPCPGDSPHDTGAMQSASASVGGGQSSQSEAGGVYKFTYNIWNTEFKEQVTLNGELIPNTDYTIDASLGTIIITAGVTTGDIVELTYNFDWFGIGVLDGFVTQTVDIINTSAFGPMTVFTLADAPVQWNSVMADLTVALCMEKLILDYDLWKGKMIFAISAQGLYSDGGGDTLAVLEKIKQNSEDRAYKALENEQFKVPNSLSRPTPAYFQAVRGMGGGMSGRLRGWKPTNIV